jgi:hypothetical protein
MRGTVHMLRAVHFARWMGGGSTRPRRANRLFTSHFLHLHCGEDGAGGAWRPLLCRRVRELFRRRSSWRGRLLAMKREGLGGFVSPFLVLPLPVPLVSLPQTLAAAAGSSPSHPLCVGLDTGRFQPHPPQPASSEERA